MVRKYISDSESDADFAYKRELLRRERYAAFGITLPEPKRPARPKPPRLLPAPKPAEPIPAIVLGHFAHTSKPFGIEVEDLIGGLWILGKNASGKTTTIERLATADMDAGRGCIVLDPAGDLIEHLLARVPPEREQDVVLLDAGDRSRTFGLNPVSLKHPGDTYQVTTASVMLREAIRKASSGWGANLQIVIPMVAHLLLVNPGHSVFDIPRVFVNDDFRARLLANVSYPPVREWWENTYNPAREPAQKLLSGSTVSRINDFTLDANLFEILTGEQTLDFPAWINSNKLVLIKLPSGEPTKEKLALADESLSLLGALILQQVKAAAFRQINTIPQEQDRPLVPFYVDEFPRFATADFGDMYRQLRKSGIVPVLAHQDLSQLKALGAAIESIPKAARHFFCFAVTGDDAPYAVKEFHPSPTKLELPLSVTPLRDAPQRLRNSEVLKIVHELDALAKRAVLQGELALEQNGGSVRTAAWRNGRDALEDAVDLYLFRAMQLDDVDALEDVSFLGVEARSRALFTYDDPTKYQHYVRRLAEILVEHPVYATSKDDTETEAQAQSALQRRLTGFNTLSCYCKVDRNGRVTEQFVTMEPLPWVKKSKELAQKRERIVQHMVAQGMIRPRTTTVPTAQPRHETPPEPPGDERQPPQQRRPRWEDL